MDPDGKRAAGNLDHQSPSSPQSGLPGCSVAVIPVIVPGPKFTGEGDEEIATVPPSGTANERLNTAQEGWLCKRYCDAMQSNRTPNHRKAPGMRSTLLLIPSRKASYVRSSQKMHQSVGSSKELSLLASIQDLTRSSMGRKRSLLSVSSFVSESGSSDHAVGIRKLRRKKRNDTVAHSLVASPTRLSRLRSMRRGPSSSHHEDEEEHEHMGLSVGGD
ncbi:hypothetical protein BCV70DRAFT_205946 [Testicularia cyperi]|uniref:Uncharacterized protein n=1 Tax=Testicularia cyperi TaxID=1882483 RepID=A0A317XQ99_9BASI|nr:hypothetical protein BCV70DRAFT_205946 [Testicularia cyperi]